MSKTDNKFVSLRDDGDGVGKYHTFIKEFVTSNPTMRVGITRHAVRRMRHRAPFLISVALCDSLEVAPVGCKIPATRQYGGPIIEADVVYLWDIPIFKDTIAVSESMQSVKVYVFPYGVFIVNRLAPNYETLYGMKGGIITFMNMIPKWVNTKPSSHRHSFQQELENGSLDKWVRGLLYRKYMMRWGPNDPQRTDFTQMKEEIRDLRKTLDNFDVLEEEE